VKTGKASLVNMNYKVKFANDVLRLERGDCRMVSDLRRLLAEKTETELGTVKLILRGNILRDEIDLNDLQNGKIEFNGSAVVLLPETVITMIASKKKRPLPSPTLPRVINDLSTDGVVQKIHPSMMMGHAVTERKKKTQYEFQRIETLPGLPDEDKARFLLEELANDPPILAVMEKYKWSVGCLAEMYPEGLVGVDEVCILGLNKNKGEKILLRLRTDDLQGFRIMSSIKATLYHELAHNVTNLIKSLASFTFDTYLIIKI